MAIQGYFFNAVKTGESYDRTYNSEDFCSYLKKIVGNGVFPSPSTNLQVTASGSDMNVTVQAGQAWIEGHKMIADDTVKTISGADPVLPRIDRIVAVCDYTNRVMNIEVKKGTAANSPVAPALVRDASRYEIGLATVRVNVGVTQIDPAYITDTRSNSSVCGWVAGLIQQVDTTTLFAQWEAAYAKALREMQSWEDAQKEAFDAWFATLADELNVNTYVEEYRKAYTDGQAETNYLYFNPAGYEYSNGDIIKVYINGMLCRVGVEYNWRYDEMNGLEIRMLTASSRGENLTERDIEVVVLKSKVGWNTQ